MKEIDVTKIDIVTQKQLEWLEKYEDSLKPVIDFKELAEKQYVWRDYRDKKAV